MKFLKNKVKEVLKSITPGYIASFVFLLIIFVNFFFLFSNTVSIAESINDSCEEAVDDGKNTEDIIKMGINTAEAEFQSNVLAREEMITVNGGFVNVINKDVVEDVDETYNVYKMKNGQLTYTYPEMDVSYAIDSITDLQKLCDEKNIGFVFFQIPYKVNKFDNQLPNGYMDGTNASADKFIEGIKNNNVNYIDYRDYILDQTDKEYEELFFDGDHHWKTETAFDSYIFLMDYWTKHFNYPIPARNVDRANFSVEVYEKSYKGSQIRRVHEWFSDAIDDFTIIAPTFETSYTHKIYSKKNKLRKDLTKKGSFEEVILYMDNMKKPTVAKAGRDNTYLGHNPCVDVITNDDVENGSILIVEDSFGRPLSSFISLNFHKTYVMDLRYYKLGMKKYLEKHDDIDYVLIAYNVSCFKKSTYKDQFDFDK